MEDSIKVYNYLVGYGGLNKLFNCPSASQIYKNTGILKRKQDKIIKTLIKNGYIEKENAIHRQCEDDCPRIHRYVRCLK